MSLVLCAGSVCVSVLHMSQALHGAEAEGNAGCVVMPGIRLQCAIYLFIYLLIIYLPSCYLIISP